MREAEEALNKAVVAQESLGEVEGEEVVQEEVVGEVQQAEGGKSVEKR